MTKVKIMLSLLVLVMAVSAFNAPIAEAGGKSHKNYKHQYSSWSSRHKSNKKGKRYSSYYKKKSSYYGHKSHKSDKSDKSHKSHKSHKSDKHHKSCKSHKSHKSHKSNKSHKSRKHGNVEVCYESKHSGEVKLIEVSKRKAKKLVKYYGATYPGEFFLDLDGDGFGDSTMSSSCPVEGYVPTGGDCAVDDPLSSPGAMEVCGDGIDNNCDGQVDEMCAVNNTFVDIVGDCDGFGSEQPYSTNPNYFAVSVDEGTGQDGKPAGVCNGTSPSQWQHVLDELPADAMVTGLVLQLNTYGIDDVTALSTGGSEVQLFVDGSEVPGAFDLVSSPSSVAIEYIDLPVSSADDGVVDISIESSTGDPAACALYDYSELVVEYTSQSDVDSDVGGFCQNGDQPAVPVTCPCGSEQDVIGYFQADPQPWAFTYQVSNTSNDVFFGRRNGTNMLLEEQASGGTSCRLNVPNRPGQDGFVLQFDQLNSAEVTACKTEINKIPPQFVTIN